MKREKVESTNISSIGYNPKSKVLEIEFLGGRIYQYYQVTKRIYQGLMVSESKGKYFHKMIKKNYTYKKVTPTKEK